MSGLHEMFYNSNACGWIMDTPDPPIPVAFDQHPQYYRSCSCLEDSSSGGTLEAQEEKLFDIRENHDYVEVVELAMPTCCDEFVKKIPQKLEAVEGVNSVQTELRREKLKVTVRGNLKIHDVLTEARRIKLNAAIWDDDD